LLKTPICFDAFAKVGGILGHGGIVVYDDQTDMVELSRHFMEFTAAESCANARRAGSGSTRAVEILEAILDGDGTEADVALLHELGDTMKTRQSVCARWTSTRTGANGDANISPKNSGGVNDHHSQWS